MFPDVRGRRLADGLARERAEELDADGDDEAGSPNERDQRDQSERDQSGVPGTPAPATGAPMNADKNALVSTLMAIRNGEYADGEATEEVRRAILKVGSATEDNIACSECIEVATVRNRPFGPSCIRSVTVRGKGLPMADIFGTAEGCSVPKEIVEAFPELTQVEWDACLRLATLVFSAFERKVE
jgi:hypothetical protein